MTATILRAHPRSCVSRSARRLGRGSLLAAAAACLLSLTFGSVAALGRPVHLPATTRLAVLHTFHRAYQMPSAGSQEVALVPARRPITGAPTTLPVLGHSTAADGTVWLRVKLPGRPNGSTGWITSQGTTALTTPWHIVVNLAGRRVTVYRDGHMLRAFTAVVGKLSTPTPIGEYFVEETVKMARGEAGGPFALALSARSNVLQEFEGGPGQIAVHGREHLGGTLGNAESHGCIRLSTASIDWLAFRIGPGTPVRIK